MLRSYSKNPAGIGFLSCSAGYNGSGEHAKNKYDEKQYVAKIGAEIKVFKN